MSKTKPEDKVVKYLKQRLTALAEEAKLDLYIDKPPASPFNSNGRPDLFIDLGPFHLRVEVKADNGVLSDSQQRYAARRDRWQPYLCHVVRGRDGVDSFMDRLPVVLANLANPDVYKSDAIVRLRHVWSTQS